jgi:hypothetical protein
MPCIRGAAISGFIRWYEQHYGAARLVTELGRLPGHTRERLDLIASNTLFDSKWYLAADVHALVDTIGGDFRERREIVDLGAREAARYTLSGVNRTLLRLFVTPALYARLGPRMWEKYYNHGSIEHTVEKAGRLTTRIRGWHAHHPLICDICMPTAVYIFQTMGLSDVRIERPACVARGNSECVYVLRWKI